MGLTPKQEAFVQSYIECGNASEAYRSAYSAGKMKPGSIHVSASQLLADPKVALRLKELQAVALVRHEMTVDDIIAELEEARVAAQLGDRPQAGAMVAATMGKAKVLGLIVEKQEHSGNIGMLVNRDQAKRMAQEFLRGDAE